MQNCAVLRRTAMQLNRAVRRCIRRRTAIHAVHTAPYGDANCKTAPYGYAKLRRTAMHTAMYTAPYGDAKLRRTAVRTAVHTAQYATKHRKFFSFFI